MATKTAPASPTPVADDRPCSIQMALDIIGDRWTILILRDAFRGVRRFEDFRTDLDIARPVLTDRLKKLVAAGVLERQLYCEKPPRHEYRLTPKGYALSPALVALMRWGDEWLSEDGPPTELVHETCGKPARPNLHLLALRRDPHVPATSTADLDPTVPQHRKDGPFMTTDQLLATPLPELMAEAAGAARPGPRPPGHLQPQGLHPPHHAVQRQLRLLHLRPATCPGGEAVPGAPPTC